MPETLHKAGYEVNFFTTGDLDFLGQAAWMRDLRFDHVEGAENPFYDGIMTGLRQAIDYEKGNPVDVTISIRDVDLPKPPNPMAARGVVTRRQA